MGLADFYLGVAKEAITALDELSEPVVMGSGGYSKHFHHAVIGSVFGAVAVEHAIATVVWVECFLLVPAKHRAKTSQLARKIRSVDDKINFLKTNTSVEGNLLAEIRELFNRRNRLVHQADGDVIPYDDWALDVESVQAINAAGRGAELDAANEAALRGNSDKLRALAREFGNQSLSLTLAGLSTPMLDEAHENVAIAERAVAALRQHMESAQPSEDGAG